MKLTISNVPEKYEPLVIFAVLSVVFFGLSLLVDVTEPLKDDEPTQSWCVKMDCPRGETPSEETGVSGEEICWCRSQENGQ